MRLVPLTFCASLVLSLTAAAQSESTEGVFSVVVMDPLAAPLSCPCVEGYAQRKYEVLGEHLSEMLGCPVQVTFAESLAKALAKDECDHADLVIGKDSVVRSDAARAGYKATPLARLTDQEGKTVQTGLIVVRSADPAQQTSDLSGYRILFGPADCDEKFAAPRKLLEASGIEVVAAAQAETTAACSDGACKIIEWGDSQHAAAVISSYAAPLLEGCGTINKGDLRVVGETAPVPFITAFVTDRATIEQCQTVRRALLSAADHPELLVALESMLGFVKLDEAYLKQHADSPQPANEGAPGPDQSTAWPDFHGPARDGRVAWLPETLPEDPKVLWSQPLLFPGMGGIAATKERVILGDRDPTNNLDAWRCFDADTGAIVWTVEYPALGRLDYDNQPRATPVIDRERVFLLGAFGDLLCVRLSDGHTLWQQNVRSQFGATSELVWGTCSTPLLADGRLIVNPGAPDASLVALDPENGHLIWQSAGERHAYASPLLAQLGGVEQVVAYDRTSLGGWDPATGRRLWTLTPPTQGDFNVPTPVVIGGKLLVVSENHGARLHAFDKQGRILPDPEALFPKLRPDMSTPVVVQDRVLCVCDKLFCLDAETLEPVWIGGPRSFESYAPLIASEDRVLAVGTRGELLLIDPLAEKYSVVSSVAPLSGGQSKQLFGFPALVGDRLYVRGEGELTCVSLRGAS